MAGRFESGPTFPYPQRASEFVEREGVFRVEEPLKLSDSEKAEVMVFEEKLYKVLKRIKDIKINTHDVYADALRFGQGKAMVEIMYKQGAELDAWVDELFTSLGIQEEKSEKEDESEDENTDDEDLKTLTKEAKELKEKKRKLRKEIRVAVFEDIFDKGNLKSGQEVVFNKLNKIITEETGKVSDLKRTFLFDENEIGEGEVVENFKDFDPKTIHLSWRLSIHRFTDEWAKTKMMQDFKTRNGEVDKIDNLKKLCKLTHPKRNLERLEGLRLMKSTVTKRMRLLEEEKGDLNEAKLIILDIYRKYINKQIADDLLLWIGSGKDGKEIFSIDTARMERYDRFLQGVGEEYDERGNKAQLTKIIEDIGRKIETTRVVEPRLEVEMTSDEEVRIAKWIIKEYDFEDCEVLKRKSAASSMGISFVKGKVKVYIPKTSKEDLVAFMSGIAHEIEGHVLSHRNWKAVDLPLKIMKMYSAGGRDAVMAEAAGKSIERQTRKAIDGFDDRPELNYYKGMKLRAQGGTFKDCLKLFFENRIKRDGESWVDVMKDEKKYKRIFNASYGNAIRLFRGHISLDDKTGRLTSTDQLKYLEQESVVKALEKEGLEALLYVNGPDIYSITDILRLGAIDIEKIQKPKMIVANKIWPILKKGLDEGLSIKDILDREGID